ncbi:complex I NDUFA9 subunit family protein [Sphingomonas sp. ID0503]|uniref:complex I NDUFA9 subunit family protein n=1 Tax=Sphingomonas sp. ID0503 TaxID=3399691 RepID=UPI003AFB4392
MAGRELGNESDKIVTLFGGDGFIGRYVAQALLRAGARVRIAGRNPKRAFFLKPQAALGQVQFLAAGPAKPGTVAAALRGADAAVNLIGTLDGDFDAAHVDAVRVIANAAKAEGVARLVQISAIGADPASASAYARSKGEGEREATRAFPNATIIRPSVVFGPEDNFINRFARMGQIMPVLPVVGAGAKFQPVYVVDLAAAIAKAALDPSYAGRTFEIGGPEVLTMAELNGRVLEWIGHKRAPLVLPDMIGDIVSRFGFLPGAPITRDQWLMLQKDNVAGAGVEGLDAFGIKPTPMAAVAPDWLVRYRRQGRFAKLRTA